jgi:hypothetical protein
MGGRHQPLLRKVGRWLRPLLDPDAEDRQHREAGLAKQLGDVGARASRISEDVARLSRRLEAFERAWPADLRRSIEDLQHANRRHASVAARLARAAANGGEREAVREKVFHRLQAIARKGGPVLVGPWTGEVGFELLYWAPFVRWALRKFRIAPERVTILSRGGTPSWYGVDSARYLDVFEVTTPDDFRVRTSVNRKQRALRSFDRDILRRARGSIPGRAASIVHPALMYSLYMPYWKQQEAVTWVTSAAEFRRIDPPRLPQLDGRLPAEYVAVRLYFSDCFPDTPANRAVAADVVRSIAEEIPVVLLGPGFRVDDHHDFSLAQSARVVTLEDVMRPDTNLAVQTAVIGGARGFVGTYGGFSYLAPLCGVQTLALYSDRNYFAHHLEFARMVFDEVKTAPFTSVDVAVLPLLRPIAAGVRGVPPGRG